MPRELNQEDLEHAARCVETLLATTPEQYAKQWGEVTLDGLRVCKRRGHHQLECVMQASRHHRPRFYLWRCEDCGGIFNSDRGNELLNDPKGLKAQLDVIHTENA